GVEGTKARRHEVKRVPTHLGPRRASVLSSLYSFPRLGVFATHLVAHVQQFAVELGDGFGDDLHFADDAHKVDVAGPSGHDVLVEVARHAGAGAAAQVDSDVKPLRR